MRPKSTLSLPCYIYALIDPRTKEVRYIGCTDSPKDRLRQHMTSAIDDPSSVPWGSHQNVVKGAWLGELKKVGLQARLQVLEKTNAQHAAEAERRHIMDHLIRGAPLTNLNAGGDGGRLPIVNVGRPSYKDEWLECGTCHSLYRNGMACPTCADREKDLRDLREALAAIGRYASRDHISDAFRLCLAHAAPHVAALLDAANQGA